MFHLQSHCSPETHLLPVRSARETSARNPSVSFYDGTHLAFGGTLDRRCHLKHVSLKQSRSYHCQTSTVHRQRIKVDDSVATKSIKNFPIGLHVLYFCFPNTTLSNDLMP
jgi:hypothetical protein